MFSGEKGIESSCLDIAELSLVRLSIDCRPWKAETIRFLFQWRVSEEKDQKGRALHSHSLPFTDFVLKVNGFYVEEGWGCVPSTNFIQG